jgi:hypothetical protein
MKKKLAILGIALAVALTAGAAVAWATTSSPAWCPPVAPAMHLYIDTHDKASGTFPAAITAEQLKAFYAGYAKAAQEEGVVVVRTYVNASAGRAVCINMATSQAAVQRMHAKAGLPYEKITEMYGVAPSDLLLQP